MIIKKNNFKIDLIYLYNSDELLNQDLYLIKINENLIINKLIVQILYNDLFTNNSMNKIENESINLSSELNEYAEEINQKNKNYQIIDSIKKNDEISIIQEKEFEDKNCCKIF